MPTQRGYITAERFEELTNLSITAPVEWERQANLAESFLDRAVGPQPSFHTGTTISAVSSTSNTLTSTSFSSDKDGYYKNLRLQVKQGTGSGYDGFVSSYDSDESRVTVTGSCSANPDSTSEIVLSQRAVFPRYHDRDADGRPVIPEAVTEATAFAIVHAYETGGSSGFSSSAFGSIGGKSAESIGSYSVTYDTSTSDAQREIGARALQILENAGLIGDFAIHGV